MVSMASYYYYCITVIIITIIIMITSPLCPFALLARGISDVSPQKMALRLGLKEQKALDRRAPPAKAQLGQRPRGESSPGAKLERLWPEGGATPSGGGWGGWGVGPR